MTWKVEWDDRATKDLRRLDPSSQASILKYLRKHLAGCQDPHQWGKPLRGNKAGLWRYRVNDYRLICSLKNETLVVLIIHVGHRKEIYSSF